EENRTPATGSCTREAAMYQPLPSRPPAPARGRVPGRLPGTPALLAALVLALAGGTASAGPPADDRPKPMDAKPMAAKPVEAKKVALHRLPKEDLLKQAESLYRKASEDYLAEVRELATAELLLEQVRQKAQAPESARPQPTPPDGDGTASPLDAARAAQDQA